MLAKTTLVALTTALALLTTALPIVDDDINYSENCDNNNHDYESVLFPDTYPKTAIRSLPPPIRFSSYPSPSPSLYRYSEDDYAHYDDPRWFKGAAPTSTGWAPPYTGFYYPTRTDAYARAMQTTRAPWYPHSRHLPMATTRPSFSRPMLYPHSRHLPMVTTRPTFLPTTYGHGYEGPAPPQTLSPEDEYYSPPPPPIHTPYPYNGGNSGTQQQQRPFGVEQNPIEDKYIFDSSTVVDGQLFDEDECRPSGKTTHYIGVDLREDSFAVGYVNSVGKIELIPNENGKLYTPAYVRFIEEGRRALVGDAAFAERGDEGLHVMASVVDLSEMNNMLESYPENVRLSLGRDRFSEVGGGIVYASTPLDKEASEHERWMRSEIGPYRQQGHTMAVVLRRAIDMAESHMALSSSGEKVGGVLLTMQHHSNDAKDDSYVDRMHISHKSAEWFEAQDKLRLNFDQFDQYPETLSLAAAHIEFFESKVQRDPLGDEDTYLPQTVLLYNLRESTEDMIVMQYIKGTFGLRPFHLKLLSGYLPHEEGLIDEKFERYLIETKVGQFNSLFGDRKRIELPDKVGLRRTFFKMDSFSEAAAATNKDVTFSVGPTTTWSLSFEEWRDMRLQFLKERLAKMVDRVLASSGLESKDRVDHLVVADVTSFDGQSIEAMESVFGLEGKKKMVKVTDPKRAVAEGIVTIAGILTRESPMQVPSYCPDYQ